MQGIGTALEKRRLDDDEAGSITETRSGGSHHGGLNLEEEIRKLDEMAEMHLREQERQEQDAWSSSAATRGSRRSRDKHGAELFV